MGNAIMLKGQGCEQLLNFIKTPHYDAMFSGITLPQKVTLNMPYITSMRSFFCEASGVEEIDITIPNNILLDRLVQSCSSVKKCKIRPSPYTATGYYMFAYNARNLEEIDCEFDMSNWGGASEAYGAFNASKLRELRIVPNTIKSWKADDGSDVLSDASIISIANGLNADTPNTYGARAAIKTKMNSIRGNVVNNLFVEDASGTMTLTEFITTVKGWTIA